MELPSMFEQLPKYVFFTGKGGVGKTSLACATAVSLAEEGLRVLLVSTDPASNVAQVFETPVGNHITPISDIPGLSALEVDPEAAADEYRERVISPLRGAVTEAELQKVTEQLSGACTTEIAAFDEFSALLTDEQVSEQYDHVIFDTAPTGHTIRLLRLPGAWSSYLDTGKGDTSCLGPLAGLEAQHARYASAVKQLSDGGMTRLILVARPTASALREAARTADELAGIGIKNQQLAVNGVMPPVSGDDPLAQALRERDHQALAKMPASLASLPQQQFPLRTENLVGVPALRRFARNEPAPETDVGATDEPLAQASLRSLVDELEKPGKGLLMFMGKGGVGKTTIAAAVAIELAGRGHKVMLSTTDPAAHLQDTVVDSLDNLEVTRIDPAVEVQRYTEGVLRQKARGMNAEELALLKEDLRSPCTEEIAVFQAFSRTIVKSNRQFVVMDTAPTGHTLLLLDTTGAYHRQMTRHDAHSGNARMVTPMMRLQDGQTTRVMIITLAETTPILEAAGLQDDLRRASIEPWAWIINASLAAATSSDPLLRQRAHAELPRIHEVANEHASRYAVVPMQADDPVGALRLRELCA